MILELKFSRAIVAFARPLNPFTHPTQWSLRRLNTQGSKCSCYSISDFSVSHCSACTSSRANWEGTNCCSSFFDRFAAVFRRFNPAIWLQFVWIWKDLPNVMRSIRGDSDIDTFRYIVAIYPNAICGTDRTPEGAANRWWHPHRFISACSQIMPLCKSWPRLDFRDRVKGFSDFCYKFPVASFVSEEVKEQCCQSSGSCIGAYFVWFNLGYGSGFQRLKN